MRLPYSFHLNGITVGNPPRSPPLEIQFRCLKSVIFVVDELDAFTRKGKQVLLYNLLDTLSHSKVQVRL